MKYPIGIQNFGEIRRDGYAYVDKTALMYKMTSEGKYYFLSRPRRFGKSLLLSTLEAYFEGERELFKGLAVEQLEQEWKRHPIMHLDLNTGKYDTAEALNDMLNDFLTKEEDKYGRAESERSFGLRFQGILRRAFERTGKRVVVLVDEYDKPLLQAIGNETLQTEYRNTLKAFYGALKSCDRYIRFAFLTGVTKFGKVSVFSDLNNLNDISMLPAYSNICGITEKELRANFEAGVNALAQNNNLTLEECYERLRRDFDGYHFNEYTKEGIYNPFSVLNTLNSLVFRDYWFETGTPSFLVYQLKKTGYPLEAMTQEELTADTLNSIDIMDENPLPLLYQSGYLTLKDYDPRFDAYILGFPNREVEEGFIKYLLPFYTPKVQEKGSYAVARFVRDVERGDAESFMRRLEGFFANGDYQVMGNLELYFQNTLYVFFRLMGFYVEVERHTTNGRMDILMQTSDYIYILELKLDQIAAVALQQIEEKGYAKPFAEDPRRLFKIGINFNTATKRIDDWVIL
ncbi:MAG: ATP-binding protein [Bacteroidaceae bacterium]|nr:ATP-binding protein [Bacteroidaceae bacterium]MBR1801537.1 ATP-binding protein [Bacteroidaceae bacterium]